MFASLNKIGVISPRYNVRLGELEKWVVKLLPARQFGYVILTTSAGIMGTCFSSKTTEYLAARRWY